MIVEGILSTEETDGGLHVAPMGPLVVGDFQSFVLKPFQKSQTFANLRRTQRGVFHVVDDALLLTKAVLGRANSSAADFDERFGYILRSATHWYAFQIRGWDLTNDRAQADAEITGRGVVRPFFGWNRAKHAIVEAAILASRIGMLDRSAVELQFDQLQVLIDKTGGEDEMSSLELLRAYIDSSPDRTETEKSSLR